MLETRLIAGIADGVIKRKDDLEQLGIDFDCLLDVSGGILFALYNDLNKNLTNDPDFEPLMPDEIMDQYRDKYVVFQLEERLYPGRL